MNEQDEIRAALKATQAMAAERGDAVTAATEQTNARVAQYVKAMGECAIASEEARRKKDASMMVIGIGLMLILELVLLLVSPIPFIILNVVAILMFIGIKTESRRNPNADKATSYAYRHSFFENYKEIIDRPPFKWKDAVQDVASSFKKDGEADETTETVSAGPWVCTCGSKNDKGSLFCVKCGSARETVENPK